MSDTKKILENWNRVWKLCIITPLTYIGIKIIMFSTPLFIYNPISVLYRYYSMFELEEIIIEFLLPIILLIVYLILFRCIYEIIKDKFEEIGLIN